MCAKYSCFTLKNLSGLSKYFNLFYYYYFVFELFLTHFCRYLKVAVTTHYGNQYYCPITVVRVHGTNHVTDLKESTYLYLYDL